MRSGAPLLGLAKYIYYSGTMIKFLLLEFLRVSQRIPQKITNVIYCFEVFAFFLEILKLKCVKCRPDDVVH